MALRMPWAALSPCIPRGTIRMLSMLACILLTCSCTVSPTSVGHNHILTSVLTTRTCGLVYVRSSTGRTSAPPEIAPFVIITQIVRNHALPLVPSTVHRRPLLTMTVSFQQCCQTLSSASRLPRAWEQERRGSNLHKVKLRGGYLCFAATLRDMFPTPRFV